MRHHSSFTVALVGADGAGKTTICRQLIAQLPWPSMYMYMGINQEACNVLLPTTRIWQWWKTLLGKQKPMGGPPAARSTTRAHRPGLLRSPKSLLRMMNLVAEEWFRQQLCWRATRAGKIVIMDRHFVLDYYAHHIAPAAEQRSVAQRFHGYMLRHFPVPDLILVLDADTEFLFDRKPEGTLEDLEARRQEYLALQNRFPNFQVINAAQPIESVLRQAVEAIIAFRSQREWSASAPPVATAERSLA